MRSLPPRYDLWPRPVQDAMRLRGALVPCGPGVRGVAWPDTPSVRLAALGRHLDGGMVAAFLTAAWVWDAHPNPGTPLQIAIQFHGTRKLSTAAVHHCELRFQPGDTVQLGAFRVTAPKRTLLDLLYQPNRFDQEIAAACVRLAPLLPGTLSQLREQLDTTRRPYARLARARFREVFPAAEVPPS